MQRQSCNPMIDIVELVGGLNARGALDLKDWLFNHLDENRCKDGLVMHFKRVTRIDGLGISTLEDFLSRGIDIRLITVRPTVMAMLRMATKKDILKRIYRDTDCIKAVSMFAKEISEKTKTVKGIVKMRGYPRANTTFSVNFKYLSDSNSEILCNAKALNLSESGIFASAIKGVGLRKKTILNRPDVAGKEFYDITFELGGNGKPIKTKGMYVWGNETDTCLGIGICFKGMRQDYKEVIRDYIYNVYF